MIKKILIILIICFYNIINISAQQFINSDLDGSVEIGIGSTPPTFWQNIPYLDPNCQASAEYSATPDLTNINGPFKSLGVFGYPYSGLTFVSGGFAQNPTNDIIYHEGIMQNVSGFVIGERYSISFHQAVIKQFYCRDTSGSWVIFLDDSMLGISTPTISHLNYNDSILNWESRVISFVASKNSHTIKFLPIDDDSNIITDTLALNGALMMAIDSIGINHLATSIKDYSIKIDAKIYPNPTSKTLTIKAKEIEQIEIYNLGGSLIKITSQQEIDLSQQEKGIYFIKVTTANGVATQKIILK